MKVSIVPKDEHIITFGEFGQTFYVVLKGSVGVFIPNKETFNFNMKEFLEFTVPRRRFIKSVNNEDLKLPNYVDILEFDEEGKICMEKLNDFLSVPYRNAQYNRTYVLRSIGNRNKNDYEFNYFIKVASLGDGFEFGGDALLKGKARNATIVAETE